MFDTCTLAVLLLMNRACPISGLDRPAASRVSTSRSVSPNLASSSGGGGAADAPAEPAAVSAAGGRLSRARRARAAASSAKGAAPDWSAIACARWTAHAASCRSPSWLYASASRSSA